MSLVLQSSGGGSVTLQEAVTASNLTITVPAETGTMITTASTFAGTGPTFSAYSNTNQSISNNTWTKLIMNVEEWDTASCFDTTNYRFTPNVAGYYQITCSVAGGGTSSGNGTAIAVYKNGGGYKTGNASLYMSGFGQNTIGTALVYLNGSTDYVEAWMVQVTGSTQSTFGSSSSQYIQGFLARAA
jgi:hypothetical protein